MCPFSFQQTIPHYPGLCLFFSASLAFLFSFITSLILIRVGFVHDVPNNRSSHVRATPTLGGIVFAVPIFLTTLWTQPVLVCASLLLIMVVGGLDDVRGLSYRTRLAAQCVAGIGVICSLSCWQTALAVPDVALWAVTLFLLMGIMNGANFIDGLNGLLSGCVMMAIIVWWVAMPQWSTLWLVCLASLLGFWVMNRGGSIFMGDLGSTFLGLWIGIVALTMQIQLPEFAVGGLCTQGFLVALAPLMFVWGDVSFTLLHRWRRGEVLSQAHRDHLIHRLADAGYGHTPVMFVYVLGTLYLGGVTLAYVWGYINLALFVACYLIPQTGLIYKAMMCSRAR